MKIFVRTPEGITFDIQVTPQDTIGDAKKKIETAQGANAYPALQQQLIHEGNDLKDGTTLEENKVAENSSVLLMLTELYIELCHLASFPTKRQFSCRNVSSNCSS